MPAPTLDGTATGQSNTTTTVAATLTTTGTNRIVCALVYVEQANGDSYVTGISGGSLTWIKRTQATCFPGSGMPSGTWRAQTLELWWAVAPAALTSATITATFSPSCDGAAIVVFGVAGCNTTNPWDANPSLAAKLNNVQLPVFSAPTFAGISTTQANDFLLFAVGTNGGGSIGTLPVGFTLVNSRANGVAAQWATVGAAYLGVTSAQSNQTFTWGSALTINNVCIFDALTADTGGSTTAPQPNYEIITQKIASSTNTITFDTAGISANNVIIVLSYSEQAGGGPAVTGISGGGLTWARRSRSHGSPRGNLELWYAKITGTLAATTMTISYAANFDCLSIMALSVVGCNSAVFDANASLPATQSNAAGSTWTPSVSVSTTQAHDLVLAATGTTTNASVASVPSGFVLMDQIYDGAGAWATNLGIGTQLRSTTQSGATVAWSSSIADATTTNAGGEYLVDALTADAPVVAGSTQARVMVLA